MSKFGNALKSKEFLVTTELVPPKGVDLQEQLRKAVGLRNTVHAINVTDNYSSNMTQSPIGLARKMVEQGIEPILQFTCRDRNRLALQADILAGAALGVENLLFMTGDMPTEGDHPTTKAVFDLTVIEVLKAAKGMTQGRDFNNNKLKDSPQLTLGAVITPGAADIEKELARAEEKVQAGCSFFQTQALFDMADLDRIMPRVERLGVPVLAGIFLLRSSNLAAKIGRLPGVHIPNSIITALAASSDPAQTGLEIAGGLIGEAKARCRGVHVMPLGWEHRIGDMLTMGGVSPTRS